MDGSRFDDLARSAAIRSRRGLIKGLAGALVGGFVGGRVSDADAATCRDAGSTCTKNAQCCANLCGEKDATGRRRCACPAGSKSCQGQCIPVAACCSDAECSGLTTGCVVGVCNRNTGSCQTTPVKAGKPCDSGYLCSVSDVCDGKGQCVATAKDCSYVEDACNVSFCNPENGDCLPAPFNDGGTCPSTNLCATRSECRGGTCQDKAFKDCSGLTNKATCKVGACDDGDCVAINAETGSSCSDDPCIVGTCQANGTCQTVNAPNNTSCGDNGQHCCYGSCYSKFDACPV